MYIRRLVSLVFSNKMINNAFLSSYLLITYKIQKYLALKLKRKDYPLSSNYKRVGN